MITKGLYIPSSSLLCSDFALPCRVKGGCTSANTVGLQDCQGYVTAGAFEPITFIDVHTAWNPRTGKFGHSQQAEELVYTINEWGTR